MLQSFSINIHVSTKMYQSTGTLQMQPPNLHAKQRLVHILIDTFAMTYLISISLVVFSLNSSANTKEKKRLAQITTWHCQQWHPSRTLVFLFQTIDLINFIFLFIDGIFVFRFHRRFQHCLLLPVLRVLLLQLPGTLFQQGTLVFGLRSIAHGLFPFDFQNVLVGFVLVVLDLG